MAKGKKKKEKEVLEQETVESGKRVSGEPESNLAAVGAGGIIGAAAGATLGAVAGPLGAGLGAAAGSVIGGAIADKAQDELDPKVEELYWQEQHTKRSYYKSGDLYEDYLPAYRFGWENAIYKKYGDRSFEQIEPQLQTSWETGHSEPWELVRDKVRDAFQRIREKTSANK